MQSVGLQPLHPAPPGLCAATVVSERATGGGGEEHAWKVETYTPAAPSDHTTLERFFPAASSWGGGELAWKSTHATPALSLPCNSSAGWSRWDVKPFRLLSLVGRQGCICHLMLLKRLWHDGMFSCKSRFGLSRWFGSPALLAGSGLPGRGRIETNMIREGWNRERDRVSMKPFSPSAHFPSSSLVLRWGRRI